MGHSLVHTWHRVQSPVFLTLNKARDVGSLRKAPHGHINLQNPFFPKKYTIKNPSIKKVKDPIMNPGKNSQISGSLIAIDNDH